MTDLIWLHEDALRDTHPVFEKAGANAGAVFVWDDAYFTKNHYGLKRRVFIYETLCEVSCAIYAGDIVETLSELMEKDKTAKLLVPASPNPKIQTIIKQLSKRYETVVVEDTPFVSFENEPDFKRFFRYWNKAKKQLLTT